MKLNKLTSGIFSIAVLFSGSLYADQPEQLFVFGDSLSDPGNYFAIYQEMELQPFESNSPGGAFIPSAPYAIGGKHFTNGDTWVEILAGMLGNPESGSPAALAPATFGNYAVGRSRARDVALEGVFSDVNLTTQVDAFLAIHDGVAPADATYVVWIGANDVGDAIRVALGGGDAVPIIGAAINNISTQLTRLYLAGARDFLLVNAPNFALTPVFQQLADVSGPYHDAVLSAAQAISVIFNQYQLLITIGLNSALLGIDIETLDVFSIMESFVADYEAHGLTVVDESCIVPDVISKAICSQPSEYLFWDGMHPTTTVHGLLAEKAYQLLTD